MKILPELGIFISLKISLIFSFSTYYLAVSELMPTFYLMISLEYTFQSATGVTTVIFKGALMLG